VVQVDGQDAEGRGGGESQACIAAQVVTGRQEEIYWDKVPERIRVDAMRRMQEQQQDATPTPAEQGIRDGPSDGKRKKRKKLA
jgi:hypothetical protein